MPTSLLFSERARTLVLSILVVRSLVLPVTALGQATCVPRAVGIPPNWRAPNWWDGGTPEYSVYGTRLDDPRWLGAVSHSDGSANAQHVSFRAVRRQDSLFLSWIVKVDPLLRADALGNQRGDILWFGIQQQGGKKPVVFRFSPSTLQTGGPTASLPYFAKVWTADPVTFGGTDYLDLTTLVFSGLSTSSTLPLWLKTPTTLWVASGAGEAWAFQTVIPTNGTAANLANGLDVGTDFKMWYQFTVEPTNDGSATWIPYAWPRDPTLPAPPLPKIDYQGVGGPWVTAWADFRLADTPASGGSCIGDLTIASNSDIGTTNMDPSKIQFTLPTKPLGVLPVGVTFDDIVPRNTFFVRPTNLTTSLIPDGDVVARFRVANWGSQGDWEDIKNAPQNLWTEVPRPSDPAKPSNNLPPGLAPDANRITLEWKMSVCQWFNFLPASYTDAELIAWLDANGGGICPRDPMNPNKLSERYAALTHQCVQAEFDTPPLHPTRSLLRRSYWNNLDVIQASKFSRAAAISVQGLSQREGKGPKTLYLYVQTFNLPEVERGTLKTLRASDTVRSHRDSLERHTDPIFDELRANTTTRTYLVHVYRESVADSVPRNRPRMSTLRAQTSFGYRVEHEGDVLGWKHELTGGATLVQLAPDFYRLTVPNDSFAIVTTTIEAVESAFYWSLHAGVSLPVGALKNTYDLGYGATVDLEYRFNPRLSLVALGGFHRFDSTGTAVSAPTRHLDVIHASAGLKARTFTSGPVAFSIDAGGGIYWFKPGASKGGAHAGVAIEYEPSLSFALGISARMHNVFTGGSNTRFAAIQVGLRVMF